MDPSDGHEPALAATVVLSEDIPPTNFDVEIYVGTYMSNPETVRFTQDAIRVRSPWKLQM
jgi:hypothetical protein